MLQFVVDDFHKCPFPEQYPIVKVHKRFFHVLPYFCDKVYVFNKKVFKKFLAYVSPLSTNIFPKSLWVKSLFFKGSRSSVFPCVRAHCIISPRSLIMMCSLKVELSHRALALGRPSPYSPMSVSSLYVTWHKWSGIDDWYAYTFAQCTYLEKQLQLHLRLPLHKAVVGQAVWKLLTHVVTYIAETEQLQVTVSHCMEDYKDSHHPLSDMRYRRLRWRLLEVSNVCISVRAQNIGRTSRIQKFSIKP